MRCGDILDRIKSIDEKLDRLLESTVHNEADIMWLKGMVKIGIPIIASVIGYLILQLINS